MPDYPIRADKLEPATRGPGLIEAADIAEAVELSKGCPILDAGGSVEVCSLRI